MPPRLAALAAIAFWGVSFVATKAALRECGPLELIVARTALGLVLLLAVLRARREALVPPRDAWGMLAVMGFVGVAFHQLLQARALTMTSASSTGWLIALTPLWSALLAAVWLRQRLGPLRLLGLLLGFAGALVVVTRGDPLRASLALPATRGDLLILASTLNWSLYTVLGHATIRRLGPLRATAGAMLAGLALLLPVAVWQQAFARLPALSAAGWSAVLFLGLCCSGLGYWFWYAALERVDAAQVAALQYLEPLVTLMAAVVLLGERVAPGTLGGGLLLLAGVMLVQRAR